MKRTRPINSAREFGMRFFESFALRKVVGNFAMYFQGALLITVQSIISSAIDQLDEVPKCPAGGQHLTDDSGEPLRCLPHHTDLCVRALNGRASDVCCHGNKVDYYCCIGINRWDCPDYTNVTVIIFKEQARFVPIDNSQLSRGPEARRPALGDFYQSLRGFAPGPQTKFGHQVPAARGPGTSDAEIARAPFNPPPEPPGPSPEFFPFLELNPPGPVVDSQEQGNGAAPTSTQAKELSKPKLANVRFRRPVGTKPNRDSLRDDAEMPLQNDQTPFNQPLSLINGPISGRSPGVAAPPAIGPPSFALSQPNLGNQQAAPSTNFGDKPLITNNRFMDKAISSDNAQLARVINTQNFDSNNENQNSNRENIKIEQQPNQNLDNQTPQGGQPIWRISQSNGQQLGPNPDRVQRPGPNQPNRPNIGANVGKVAQAPDRLQNRPTSDPNVGPASDQRRGPPNAENISPQSRRFAVLRDDVVPLASRPSSRQSNVVGVGVINISPEYFANMKPSRFVGFSSQSDSEANKRH